MIARFVTGIGTGIETSTVPMYQSELCEAERRGRLVSSEPLFVGVGIEIAYWFDYGMSYKSGSIAWRLPIACQMIFAVIVIVLVFGLPESPRYLYKHGRSEEAMQIMCDVYDGTPDTPKIAKENADILEALKIEQENGEYRWSQLMKRDEVQTGRRVLLAYGMQVSNSFLSPNSRSISIRDVSDLLHLVYEPNGRHQSGRLLYHIGLTTQCRTRSKSVIVAWGRYQLNVLCRVSVSNVFPRQVWPTQTHDVGIVRFGFINDAHFYSSEFPRSRWKCRKGDSFCERNLLLHCEYDQLQKAYMTLILHSIC
jgi:hypothetical protein